MISGPISFDSVHYQFTKLSILWRINVGQLVKVAESSARTFLPHNFRLGRIHFNHDLILHELCDNFSIFLLRLEKKRNRKVYRHHKTNIPELFVLFHVSGSFAIMKGIINLEKCQNCCKKICCNNLPPSLPGCFAGKLSHAG